MAPAETLGTTRSTDSEDTPASGYDFPWHTAAALIVSYAVGALGYHWSYLLFLFWLLVHADERRIRRLWAILQGEALVAAAAVKDEETVTWINQLLRAIWPMYEQGVARYALGKLQPMLDQNLPRHLGVFAVGIKSLTFGTLEQRRADGRHRLSPLLFDKMRMVSKSVEPSTTRDPKQHRVRFVVMTDVRWHMGSAPSLVLDIQLGPRFLSLSVDAEASRPISPALATCSLPYISFRSTPQAARSHTRACGTSCLPAHMSPCPHACRCARTHVAEPAPHARTAYRTNRRAHAKLDADARTFALARADA